MNELEHPHAIQTKLNKMHQGTCQIAWMPIVLRHQKCYNRDTQTNRRENHIYLCNVCIYNMIYFLAKHHHPLNDHPSSSGSLTPFDESRSALGKARTKHMVPNSVPKRLRHNSNSTSQCNRRKVECQLGGPEEQFWDKHKLT